MCENFNLLNNNQNLKKKWNDLLEQILLKSIIHIQNKVRVSFQAMQDDLWAMNSAYKLLEGTLVGAVNHGTSVGCRYLGLTNQVSKIERESERD